MAGIPTSIDDEAFSYVSDLGSFGIEGDELLGWLARIVENADLLCNFGEEERLSSYLPVQIQAGALLRYRQGEWAGVIAHLLKIDGRMHFVGMWPQFRNGSSVVADILSLVKSSEGCEGHAELELLGMPSRSIWVHLPEYACGAGLWERGGRFDLRLMGLPLEIQRAPTAPIVIGPEAPVYAGMVQSGMRPNAGGQFEIQVKGLAAFFHHSDSGPNVYEFRGPIVAIRPGGIFLDIPYRIAEIVVMRREEDDGDRALSFILCDKVGKDFAVGDDVMGIAVMQATALASAPAT